jgi:hypothetical protein
MSPTLALDATGLVLRLAPSCTLHTICISRLQIVFISKKKLEQKLFF